MNVVTLTDDNFETEVNASDKPVLVDYWATWCGPCIEEMPSLAQAKKEWADQYTFLVASDEELERLVKFQKKERKS